MTVNFASKILGTRPYPPKPDLNADLEKFESDRGRIINSAAVRRLQQKTQVFPLERNAAVRSRLTHSLEVQQVGRYISQLICKALVDKQDQYQLNDLERQLESIVEMSCLMHDIGNPPFGHFGEAALIDWLRKNLNSLYLTSQATVLDEADKETPKQTLPEAIHRDLVSFEGNAQGIRLIHSLLKLNLTYSQASGILKYTRCGSEAKPTDNDPFNYLKKKVGYYLSEQSYVQDIRNSLDIGQYCRSPFSYIMEAADDVSYGIADLEDAMEKGVLSVDDLKTALTDKFASLAVSLPEAERETMSKMLDKASTRGRESNSMFFVFLRVEVNQRLPEHAKNQFVANLEAVFKGSLNRALIEDGSVNHLIVETFKSVALEHCFCHPEVEARELQGYQIISGLMACYQPLLELSQGQFEYLVDNTKPKQKSSAYLQRLFKKLPAKHLAAYQKAMTEEPISEEFGNQQCREFYYRTRLIIDYISGMTDQYAYDEFRAFNVISDF
ncbi:dGTPase [Agarivorans aestuarii]|uniref:Probable deoxyguanosinetriphosphate triphosphohydrolase n=1 Tax=Agarivorans aestuarii TaxID=1563703 RepID=A0ABU7G312_9ALTE|nr:dGTPase [Agarivorans aestuarii]MEE1673733.1 dGTPase [Agarivorans aestuarii]